MSFNTFLMAVNDWSTCLTTVSCIYSVVLDVTWTSDIVELLLSGLLRWTSKNSERLFHLDSPWPQNLQSKYCYHHTWHAHGTETSPQVFHCMYNKPAFYGPSETQTRMWDTFYWLYKIHSRLVELASSFISKVHSTFLTLFLPLFCPVLFIHMSLPVFWLNHFMGCPVTDPLTDQW